MYSENFATEPLMLDIHAQIVSTNYIFKNPELSHNHLSDRLQYIENVTGLVTELEVKIPTFRHVSQTNVCVMGGLDILSTIFCFFNIQKKHKISKLICTPNFDVSWITT